MLAEELDHLTPEYRRLLKAAAFIEQKLFNVSLGLVEQSQLQIQADLGLVLRNRRLALGVVRQFVGRYFRLHCCERDYVIDHLKWLLDRETVQKSDNRKLVGKSQLVVPSTAAKYFGDVVG